MDRVISFFSNRRDKIPAELRSVFEKIGEVPLELALMAGQGTEPWLPEVADILRDDQSRACLWQWLKEQR